MDTDFSNYDYTPILKWKQGEYQALLRLSDRTKYKVLPLVDIPPIGWDFEKQKYAKTLDEHLEPFSRRLRSKWGNRPIFVDLHLLDANQVMANGQHPVEFAVFAAIDQGANPIPVTAIDRQPNYQSGVKACISNVDSGVCIRVTIEHLGLPDLPSRIASLVHQIGANIDNLHIVVDLEAPSFDPLAALAGALKARLNDIPNQFAWRTFTLVGTSFPESMASLKTGPQVIPRSEWLLYKLYVSMLSQAELAPNFGDYTISHPVTPEGDMRLLQPSASIRYTIDDAWYILKGKNVRRYKFHQYRSLCGNVASSSFFYGSNFSEGDRYIVGCYQGGESTGNLTTWRWVGVNHHITKVVDDLSKMSEL